MKHRLFFTGAWATAFTLLTAAAEAQQHPQQKKPEQTRPALDTSRRSVKANNKTLSSPVTKYKPDTTKKVNRKQ